MAIQRSRKQFLKIEHSLAPSSERPAPYGANGLENTNPTKLTASIMGQLKDAGWKSPEVDLFPDKPDENTLTELEVAKKNRLEGSMIPGSLDGNKKAVVTGLQPHGNALQTHDAMLSQGIYQKDGACGLFQSEKNSAQYRAWTALHETSHYVAHELGLNQTTADTAVKNNPGYEPGWNVSERIADTSAALYSMSNYMDGDKTVRMVRDMRQAEPDPAHGTTSSLDAATKAFAANPKKGLTIVDATKWAADIVAHQTDLQNVPQNAFDQIATGKPKTDGADSKPLPDKDQKRIESHVREATDARQRLCAP